MADPLSIASGVAGLVSLTIQATQLTCKYVAEASEAGETALQCLRSLSLLRDVLARISETEQSEAVTSIVTRKSELISPDELQKCTQNVERVRQRLQALFHDDGKVKRRKALTWPFQSAESAKLIKQLQDFRDTLASVTAADSLEISAKSHAVVSDTQKDVCAIKATIQSGLQDEEARTVLDWISPDDPEHWRLGDGTTAPVGDGSFFLDSVEFKDWQRSPGSILWTHGAPGSGKSILMSQAISYFHQHGSMVLSHFCDHRDPRTQSPELVMRHLIKQAAQYSAAALEDLRTCPEYLNHKRSGRSLCMVEAERILLEICLPKGQFVIILDGLDECAEQLDGTEARHHLMRFLNLAAKEARVLVASRHLADIDTGLCCMQFKVRAPEANMRDYVMERLAGLEKRMPSATSLTPAVVDKIVGDADGIFLLARLAMDILAPTSIKNLRQIKKFLTEKSLGLSEMYQATYSRIKSSDATTGDLARRVILWICYAQRPLHEVELQHAIATELEDEDFDPDGITPGDLLRSSCMGLVTYDDEGMYSLFHLTAYEFFRSNPDMTSDASHLLISRTCLAYLSFSSTGRQGPCEDLATLEARKLEFRLLDYAAKHGADHIRQVEAALLEDVISFLHEDTLRQAFMQAFYHRHRDDEDLRRITFEALPSGSSPLQVACGRGLVSTAEKLLQDGADPESHDAQGWTPLIAATSYGHLRVVQLLLSRAETTNGSVTNFSDFAYNKNAWYQNRSSVGLNRPDNNGWTPLFWAIIKNQYKAAEQLLIAGSYIGVQDEAEWTPIDWAAFRADRAFVDLILRFTPSGQLKGPRRERPMIYRPQKFSPLFLAAAGGDHQSIEAMLKFGIESPTTTTTTKESMGMLFDFLAKVDPRSKDYREGHGSTSLPSLITTNDFSTKLLESAILLDQRTIVKMLVELGASLGPVKTEVKKRSPLHIASCCGHYQICEYLLLKGASPSLLDADGLTAMDLAIMIGHPKCVRLFLGLSTPSSSLLERGTSLTTFVFGLGYGGFGKIRSRTTHDEEICCDPRLPESALPMLETRTPGSHGTLFDTQPASTSQGTFEFGDMADVVKALFRPGCDLEAKNECWKPVDEYWESNVVWTDEKNTALHHACFIASPGLISFLLTKGAQVNPQNDAGETPLHEACSRYGTSGETIRRLVLHGANINALDKNGHSPLINACKHTSIEVIQCLVANGAVVKTYGDNDYHPLHAACQRDTKPSTALMETIEIIDYLISLSNSDILSFECQDPSCGSWAVTALHIAIRAKNWEVVEHLQTLGATITNPSFLSFDLWECARDPRGRNFRRLLDLGASASGMHSSYPFIYHTFIAHYLGRYLWAHKTADHGFEEDLEALLLAGADINARSRFDSAPLLKDVTVLRMALCTGLDDSFIQILLRHGAVEDEEVEIQSTEGGLTEDETTEDESIEVEVAC